MEMILNKNIFIGIIVLIITIPSFVGYMIYFDLMLIRTLLLIQENPIITYSMSNSFFRESEL